MLVFHWRIKPGVVFIGTGITLCTKAALGEKVPAKPPLSFHPRRLPLTQIAMSWLKPAFAVHRSAFPPRMATQSAVLEAGIVALRMLESIGVKVMPSLLGLTGCAVSAAFTTFVDAKNWIVSVVGGKTPPIGPAPATMIAPLGRFVFHCSLT